MPNNETIEERIRSVEQNATETARESAAAQINFADQHRNADEMIRRIKAKHENAGARPDALAATIKEGKTAYRLEVTMASEAAEAIYGTDNGPLAFHSSGNATAEALRTSMWLCSSLRSRPDNPLTRIAELLASRHAQASLQPPWIDAVLKLDSSDHTAEALDELFAQVDQMLSAQEFDAVDKVIAAMPLEGPSLSLMMGLLSITRPAADHLPSRERFFERVYRLCKAMRRDAESLLGGLRKGENDGPRPLGG
jgi:hypothetical protein